MEKTETEAGPSAVPLADLLVSLESALLTPTQEAAALPSPSDLAFERTLSRPLGKSLDATSTHIFDLVTALLQWVDPTKNAKWAVDGELVVEGLYQDVVERVEGLLESADENIEEAMGTGKRSATVGAVGAKPGYIAPSSSRASPFPETLQRLPPHILHADIPKPQLLFLPALYPPPPPLVSADPTEPLWKPIITTKPNALSLAPYIVKEQFVPEPRTGVPDQPPRWRYAHPYAAELATLKPPPHYFMAPMEPERKAATSFEDTPFMFVDTPASFEEMMSHIEGQERKELAIDLEHHDLRSWTGLCSLIQISTRTKDFVIDTLSPTLRPILQQLNKYLTNPEFIKVFHGARSDVVWLQRDFGLYVVGLFDTYHATILLDHPQHSLASLLARYTTFVPDKRYQLADWRIRPLPTDMLHYARSDTHFLLDIYDHLRLALMALPREANALESVFDLSTAVASLVHDIPPYDREHGLGEGGWRSLLARWRKLSTVTGSALPGWGRGETSLEVLRSVHEWREATAREEDESPRFVMTSEVLLRVVEARPTNKEELGKLRVGGVGRRRSEALLAAVKRGVEQASASSLPEPKGAWTEGTEQPAVKPVTDGLWADGARSPVAGVVGLKSSTSSFFGTAVAPSAVSSSTSSLATSSSSFFGATKNQVAPAKMSAMDAKKAAVERIHAGLILGGGLADSLKPKFVPASLQPSAIEEPTPMEATVSESTPDHSFVPLTARQTKATAIVASSSRLALSQDDPDVLIVSSLADKPKKRRRAKEGEEASTKKSKQVKEERVPVVPFDYSTQKSILDAEPAGDSSRANGKGKKDRERGPKKGFEVDTSDFRKQPRVNNASKKGNVSRSFAN